jgi:16S rRNA (uracil1498-N3)-methyltransferase
MTRRRWIADEVHGDTAALIGKHAVHLSRVLRAQVGQEFDIATGHSVREGKISSVSDNRVEFALGPELTAKPPLKLTLLLSVFKFDRMEWAIEKCTEIGITCMVPLIARRTDSHLASAALKRRERWQRIARQASEQARRFAPPEIGIPLRFKDLDRPELAIPKKISNDGEVQKIVLAESESESTLGEILRRQPASATAEIILAVGPEGGWTDDELAWFRQSGWKAASLGENILRAETAAIVATALVLDVLH